MATENEWYNLKHEIAQFLVPRLKVYKESFESDGVAIPTWVSESQINVEELSETQVEALNREWLDKLEEMILAFELVMSGDALNPKLQSGLNTFAKYYQHLWD